ncbi:hypothetical protein VC83_00385 [Pseudogymnoascus destructans]|uniref:Uncharacterized protein n=1 Tax=Pseudogymnoascus destructans TaxID=655981 RepID=A0A177AN05_9PEZI|nr:uncharacterized protein VC83_00385 [Pseudogymnoascus destructans]OAF62862.1 hypothetical protein VC83_00385 [Pseudogymnoascus destructans]
MTSLTFLNRTTILKDKTTLFEQDYYQHQGQNNILKPNLPIYSSISPAALHKYTSFPPPWYLPLQKPLSTRIILAPADNNHRSPQPTPPQQCATNPQPPIPAGTPKPRCYTALSTTPKTPALSTPPRRVGA